MYQNKKNVVAFVHNADSFRCEYLVHNAKLTDKSIIAFQKHIYFYFDRFGRTFSWRQTTNPYQIVVSEIMLQQTQTNRVEGKFEHFVEVLPDFHALACAPLSLVLSLWQGLGYNRRAKALHAIAKKTVHEFNGKLPADQDILQTFPGIGKATAASICSFAFNMPVVFIETNIRSLFIHFFFRDVAEKIKDSMLMPLVTQTLDTHNSRMWYYALTDYGVALKKAYPQLNKKSAHYTRQSRFEGSCRQIRGKILHKILAHKSLSREHIINIIGAGDCRVSRILEQLVHEGFIKKKGDTFTIV